ncbi:hypothetical protein [Lacipirellula sp.]|uniref:hypothetical protein n=1 Tax=Lacipirellula sp. TaxID=2691419 RepID=UPI003D0E994E
MAAIRDALEEIVDEYTSLTVRQCFYQAVGRGVVDKTEQEYKGTVCRLLADMRRDGTIPYHKLSDNTRWQRKPTTFSGLEQMLENTQRTYRRAIWDEQPAYVEIWLEKDALAGVLWEVTRKWDVPLMVTRGYPSISYLHEAAEAIAAQGKPAFLYYFGDRDPSGVDIDRCVEKQIREMAPDADLHFERVGVTEAQIAELSLPTRPTKKTDSRSKGFEGESVEVDAIDPETLCQICDDCIRRHIDFDSYYRMREVENAERDTLATLISNMGGEL